MRSICELVVPPQTAQIVLRNAFPHRVGGPTVLEFATRKKLFRPQDHWPRCSLPQMPVIAEHTV